MNRIFSVGTLVVAFSCGVVFGQIGGTTSGDPRVKRLLDEAGLKYSLTKAHDFKLLFAVDDNRSQLVFVNSNTENYKQFEVREIWSVAYRSTTKLTAGQMRMLLTQTAKNKLGEWSLTDVGDEEIATFTVKAAAVLSKDDLETLIRLVTSSADEMEKELTGSDDL